MEYNAEKQQRRKAKTTDKITTLHGWSRTTESDSIILNAEADFPKKFSAIPRGAGLSYGDAALNQNGFVLVGRKCFYQIDELRNEVAVSGDVKVAELLNYLKQFKKTLLILPGSSRITIGGCIASNIHGKNHHKDGSFSQIVRGITLIVGSNNEEIYCDRKRNRDLFEATLGGMGLTGYISKAYLKINPAPNLAELHQVEFDTLEDLFKKIDSLRSENLNVLALVNWSAGPAGRGKILTYSLVNKKFSNRPKKVKTRNFLAFQIPLINKLTIRIYNKLQFRPVRTIKYVNPNSVIFLADRHRNANLWFGKKGFIEYQFSISVEAVDTAIMIMRDFYKNFSIFLSGVKLLSDKSTGMLNFYQKGFTITLTTTPSDKLYRKLDEYDSSLIRNGGRIYLAKDSRLSASNFAEMYSSLNAFQALRSKMNLQCFESDLSRRLSI